MHTTDKSLKVIENTEIVHFFRKFFINFGAIMGERGGKGLQCGKYEFSAYYYKLKDVETCYGYCIYSSSYIKKKDLFFHLKSYPEKEKRSPTVN